jgi:hypothetical protein
MIVPTKLPHAHQAVIATNNLFFKERGTARCGHQAVRAALKSSTASLLRHDQAREDLSRCKIAVNEILRIIFVALRVI